MCQIHQIDNFKIRPIKVEIIEESIPIISYEKDQEEFLFFWKANDDPWDLKEKSTWAPYDYEDQYVLKQAYNKYLEDKNQNKVVLKDPADHFIDFSRMLQISKLFEKRQRPVQRCHPNLITNIVLKNRFSNSDDNNFQIKTDFIEQETLIDNKSFSNKIKNQNTKKINKISFKIFPDFPCELEIEEKLCFFVDRTCIEVSLKKIKFILIKEIEDLAKDKNDSTKDMIGTALEYKKHIEQIKDHISFFRKIVYIYTMEGYLYPKLNSFLRTMNKSAFDSIKYYYTCLLASFQFINQNTNINHDKELIVYRASRFSEEEFTEYKHKKNSNIIRVFKEFLSTSRKPELPKNHFFHKNDKEIREFFWEIRIPENIIKNESSNFADISIFSQFNSENEILIKSGSIIQIDEIVPYTEQEGKEIKTYKNKFKKLCTLKSFSLACFFKLISFDSKITKLSLIRNN